MFRKPLYGVFIECGFFGTLLELKKLIIYCIFFYQILEYHFCTNIYLYSYEVTVNIYDRIIRKCQITHEKSKSPQITKTQTKGIQRFSGSALILFSLFVCLIIAVRLVCFSVEGEEYSLIRRHFILFRNHSLKR